ncbi:MAG: ATP-binding protein [Balneolaceae bacterium]
MKMGSSIIGLFILIMLFWGDVCWAQQTSKATPSFDITNSSEHRFSPAAQPFIQTFNADFRVGINFWDIIQDDQGIMYFGNNNFGIQQFDGTNWTTIAPPNRSAAYGLAKDKEGTIFAGVRGDFGYLAPDSLQQLQFQSLLSHAPDSLQNFDRVYVEIIDESVFFCTNPYLFRWKDGIMTTWENPDFMGCGVSDNTLYVNDLNRGLLALVDDSFQPVSSLLQNTRLWATLQTQEGTLFLTTQAVFIQKGDEIYPFKRFSDIHGSTYIHDAVVLRDDNIALATSTGIYIYTPAGQLVYHLTQLDGLSSDEVNGLYVDEGGNLWASTSQYINFIEYNSPLRHLFNAKKRSVQINTVIEHNGVLHIGTDNGMFTWEEKTWKHKLPGKIIRKFANIGDALLIGARDGLFVYDNGKLTQLGNTSANVLIASERYKELAYVYYHDQGIYVIKKSNNGNYTSYPLIEFTERIYTLIEDKQGDLWRGTGNWGIYRDRLVDKNGQPEVLETLHYTHEDGLPAPSYNYTTKVAGEVGFITEEGLFRFDTNQQRIVRDMRFIEVFPPESGRRAWPTREDKLGHVWFDFGGKRMFEMIPDGEGNYQLNLGPYGRLAVFGDGMHFLTLDEETTLYGTLSEAFLINRSLLEAPRYTFNTLLRSVSINNDSLLWGGYGPIETTLENDIHFTRQAVRFNWSAATYYLSEGTDYRYRLKGLDKSWSNWTNETYRDFTNLNEGSYTFEVQARNIYDVIGRTASMQFSILPPWYRSWWAYGLYVILGILGLVFTVQRLVKWRIHQQMIEMQAQQAEELKKLDVIKSQFFSNVSHELRTPLTLTIGPLEDLSNKKSGLSVQEASKVSLALRNSKRLLTLVSEILDISRLEASDNKLLVTKLDLASFVSSIFQNFSSLANRNNINFTIQAPDSLDAWFNQDQIDKVITNLLSNSFKFTPDGNEISVFLAKQNEQAVIKVSDSGMGISQKDLPFIFDRFYQSSNSKSRLQHGTGIGLALVKHLVELHGGTITAESELGAGTTFTIILPLNADTLPHAQIEERSSYEASIVPKPIVVDGKEIIPFVNSSALDEEDHTTVLVVEDNLELRQFVVSHLREHYRIIEANNGKEGLQKAKEFLPDLIISDVMMPEMDGFEMVDQLRKDPAINFIPVIMLTGKDTKVDTVKGLDLGANDYIVKPFDMDEFKARVRSMLNAQKLLKARFKSESTLFNLDSKKLKSADQKFVEEVKNSILKNLEDSSLSVESLAAMVNVGRTTLHRKLTSILGETPVQLIRKIRLEQAKIMIENKSGSISEIAYSVGFESISWFSKCFKEEYNASPSEFGS